MFDLPSRRDLLDNLRHLVHFSSRALLLTGPTHASSEHMLRALQAAEGVGLKRISIDVGALAADSGSGRDAVLSALHERLSTSQRADTIAGDVQGDLKQSILGLLRTVAMNAQLAGKRLLLTFLAVDRSSPDLPIVLLDLLYADPELTAAFCIMFTAQTDSTAKMAGAGEPSKRFLQIEISRLTSDEFNQYAELQLGRLAPSSRELQRQYRKHGGLPEAVDAFFLGSAPEPASRPVVKSRSRSDGGKPLTNLMAAVKRQRLLLLSLLAAGLGTAVLATVFLTDETPAELTPMEDDHAVADTQPVPEADEIAVPVESVGEAQEAEKAMVAARVEAEDSSELVERMREQFIRQRAAGGFELDAEPATLPVLPKVDEMPAASIPDPEPLAVAPAEEAPAERVPSPSGNKSGQGAKVSPDASVAAAPGPSVSERFRTADWVAARRSDDWTIQLLGSYSQDLVERFLNDNSELGDLVYIQTTYKNKPWFIVLNGSYKSKSAAQAALRRFPARLKPGGFWIRPFDGLK